MVVQPKMISASIYHCCCPGLFIYNAFINVKIVYFVKARFTIFYFLPQNKIFALEKGNKKISCFNCNAREIFELPATSINHIFEHWMDGFCIMKIQKYVTKPSIVIYVYKYTWVRWWMMLKMFTDRKGLLFED